MIKPDHTLERKFRPTTWVFTLAAALAPGRSRGLAERTEQQVTTSARRNHTPDACLLAMRLAKADFELVLGRRQICGNNSEREVRDVQNTVFAC